MQPNDSTPGEVPTLATGATPESSATVPTDPFLIEVLKSLETPLEVLTAQSLEGAQQELEDSLKYLDEPITVPTFPRYGDDDLNDLFGPIIMHGEEAEVEAMVRSITAWRWGIPEADAPTVARHLTMLDRLTYQVLTGNDPSLTADPEQVQELLPVAQLAAAAITRLMNKTKEN